MANENIIVTMTLKDQFTNKVKKVEGSVSQMRQQLNQLDTGTKRASSNFAQLTGTIFKSAPAFAVATAAITAVYSALRSIRDEFVGGLKAIEDYNLAVATMAGFMTTFSQQAKNGDLNGAFEASVAYSKELVEWLEVLDAKTVATGQDLTLMAQQFIKAGVQIDMMQKGAEEGIVNIANALILLTAGQNKTKQIAQEIRGVMSGESKESNVLLRLLKDQNKQFEQQFQEARETGKELVFLGEQLAGMGESVVLLQETWEAVGSTMSTIHKQILRAGFAPIYDDLLNMAKNFNGAMLEQLESGQQNKGVVLEIKTAWYETKQILSSLGTILTPVWDTAVLILGMVRTSMSGWAALLAAIDPILNRISATLSFIPRVLKLAATEVKYMMTRGETDEQVAELKASWAALGEKLGAAFAKPLKEEIEDSILSYYDGLEKLKRPGAPKEKTAAPEPAATENEEVENAYARLDMVLDALAKKFQQRGEDIKKSLRTPLQVYQDAINELTVYLRAGVLSQDEFGRGVDVAADAYTKATLALGKMNEKVKESESFIRTFSETIKGRLENSFSDTWSKILDGTANFKEAMINIINEMVVEMMRIMFFKPAANWAADALMAGFGGGSLSPWKFNELNTMTSGLESFYTANAKGNVFKNGLGKFSNSVVNKPTIFPFAKGIGLMGERGPEAIMPLTRTPSGDLGVKSEGAGNTFNINISAVDAKSVHELMARNPGAVIGPLMKELEGGNIPLRSTIRRTL